MVNSTPQVLVVGAGPSGLTVANELVRHGVGVRIIDRAPAAATTSRALVVQPRCMEILEDMGVVDGVLATGREAASLNIMFTKDNSVRMDVRSLLTDPANYTTYQTLFTLSQNDTERILTAKLAERGVRIEREMAVTDVKADRDGVTVRVNDDQEIRCDWVVGCDGSHSAVRDAVKIPFEGSTYADEFIMADAELDWELPDGDIYAFPSRDGFVGVFGMPGTHRFRIFGNVEPGPDGPSPEYSEPSHHEFQAMLDERLPIPATVVKEHWVSRYRLHRRIVPRYRDGRIFLVGDAAHVHSPAGAQGMNTGIQDAYNLSWKLALVVRGIARESVLDSYHTERHPIGERLLKTTDRFFAALSGNHPARAFVRMQVIPRVVPRVFTRRSFRTWFIGMTAQLRTAYPHSPLNHQDGTGWKHAPAPGDRAREADIVINGEPGHPHDLLRGTQHTVLLFAGTGDVTGLVRVADQIERVYPNLVKAYVISAENDPDRSAHSRYGIEQQAAFVIRPDLHIGYRGTPIDAGKLLADLAGRLPGASAMP